MERTTKTILIIDDDKVNRELVREVLESAEFQVLEAARGDVAFRIMAETIPDLVLLDILMPCQSGVSVLQEIRSDEQLRSMPVLALTAKAMCGDREEALAQGFDGYITKPIDIRQLRMQVGQLLSE